eukprot:1195031-Prorocentrum_minimum.AAC.3
MQRLDMCSGWKGDNTQQRDSLDGLYTSDGFPRGPSVAEVRPGGRFRLFEPQSQVFRAPCTPPGGWFQMARARRSRVDDVSLIGARQVMEMASEAVQHSQSTAAAAQRVANGCVAAYRKCRSRGGLKGSAGCVRSRRAGGLKAPKCTLMSDGHTGEGTVPQLDDCLRTAEKASQSSPPKPPLHLGVPALRCSLDSSLSTPSTTSYPLRAKLPSPEVPPRTGHASHRSDPGTISSPGEEPQAAVVVKPSARDWSLVRAYVRAPPKPSPPKDPGAEIRGFRRSKSTVTPDN